MRNETALTEAKTRVKGAVTTLEKGYYSLLNLKIPTPTGKVLATSTTRREEGGVQTRARQRRGFNEGTKPKMGYLSRKHVQKDLKHVRSPAYRQSTDTRFSYLDVQSNTKIGEIAMPNDCVRREKW